jgi:hypothetical protein
MNAYLTSMRGRLGSHEDSKAGLVATQLEIGAFEGSLESLLDEVGAVNCYFSARACFRATRIAIDSWPALSISNRCMLLNSPCENRDIRFFLRMAGMQNHV